MNARVSRLWCLILYFVGLAIWAAAVYLVFFLILGDRLSFGVSLARISIVWLGIDAVLLLLLYIGHLSSGAPMRRKTSWFATPWWVKVPTGVVFFPGVLILIFAMMIGYNFLYVSPQELPKPSPSYFADAGQDIFVKKTSAKMFLKGLVAPQGDGKLIVVDSPVPAGRLYTKGTELQAIGDRLTPSWGHSIEVSKPILPPGPGDRDNNQRPYDLSARVRFPQEPDLHTPILLQARLAMDCVYAQESEGGFVNARGSVESELFWVLIGPQGTAKYGSSMRAWGMLAFIVFVPTIIFATYFLMALAHVLGFNL